MRRSQRTLVHVSSPRRRLPALLATALVLLALSGCGAGKQALVPTCRAVTPTGIGSYAVTPGQAANAATIAAVGRRSGLGDHAITIALATALQESGLNNLTYGDRDSVGLFQQRPSQGWGTRERILEPRLASAAFYERLRKVPGWASLPVTEAAQAVQHSAAPAAYAQWEDPARALARAFTGQIPAGLSCTIATPKAATSGPAVLRSAALDLGPNALQHPRSTAATDWSEATWLVAHAQDLSLRTVSTRGQSWSVTASRWQPDPAARTVGITFG